MRRAHGALRWLPLLAWAAIVLHGVVRAEPSTLGQTGLVNMPDARIEPDGTLRFGVSHYRPYLALWSSVTLLPRLELSGRYTTIRGLPGGLGPGFGDYKDKAFDAKLLLLREGRWRPAVAVGLQDFLGTQLFSARFVALGKRVGGADLTVGYGSGRIGGLFGGVRYRPPWSRRLAFVAEHDATRYRSDFRAASSGAASREGGLTYGVEYRWGWLGAQVTRQGGDTGLNAWVSIPLMDREFIPKIHEPPPWTKPGPAVELGTWLADTSYAQRLGEALHAQGFRHVRLRFTGTTLEASLTHPRISLIGRAVGRAARTLLLLGPADTQAIRITYTENDLPVLTYSFTDTRKLRRYFDGLLSRAQLDRYVEITYPDPADAARGRRRAQPRELDRVGAASSPTHTQPEHVLELELEPAAPARLVSEGGEEGHIVSFRHSTERATFRLVPFNLGVYLNDPSGVFHYDLFATASYLRRWSPGTYTDATVRVTLAEDVSEVTQPSNSLLPHVRTDVAEYKKRGRVRLLRLLVNRYAQPAERVYARLSAGIYEEMFAGAGAQALYLPAQGRWAADLSVDWLRQRAPGGALRFRGYSVLTVIGAFHYRLPRWGLTATIRAGRFLAKDEGARFEIKRRFRSGVEFGAWYTVTNGNDITSPGRPGDPYYDKGVFVSIPLNIMLTKDTRARANFSLAPWTRDVGQMVASPGDLYTLFERDLLLATDELDPMSRFGQ